jgi:hypothetical protein
LKVSVMFERPNSDRLRSRARPGVPLSARSIGRPIWRSTSSVG